MKNPTAAGLYTLQRAIDIERLQEKHFRPPTKCGRFLYAELGATQYEDECIVRRVVGNCKNFQSAYMCAQKRYNGSDIFDMMRKFAKERRGTK